MKTKQVKKEQAIARAAQWNALSDAAKLAILATRPGKSKKQIQKLNKPV